MIDPVSFFKRKPKPDADLAFARARGAESLSDDRLVSGLRKIFEGQLPIVPAMFLVAYENMCLLNQDVTSTLPHMRFRDYRR